MLWQNKLTSPNLRTRDIDVKSRGPLTYRNLNLLRELVRRDFQARFAGSALGLFWAVLQPLSMVLMYWFVFTYMFGRGPGSNPHYFEFLIAGLLPWLGIAEGLSRSTTVIVENAPMVRKLAFRSELLVVVPNASAILFEAIGLSLFVISLVGRGMTPRYIYLLPFAFAIQMAIQVGLGWILAVTHVFFRDLGQILGFALSLGLYLSPILYQPSEKFAALFVWNPMTPLLGLFRSALLSSALPAASSIVFLLFVAIALFTGGLLFFRRAQATLADLI